MPVRSKRPCGSRCRSSHQGTVVSAWSNHAFRNNWTKGAMLQPMSGIGIVLETGTLRPSSRCAPPFRCPPLQGRNVAPKERRRQREHLPSAYSALTPPAPFDSVAARRFGCRAKYGSRRTRFLDLVAPSLTSTKRSLSYAARQRSDPRGWRPRWRPAQHG